ncbi:hypothetical protein ACFLUJ_02030 [Chloroflexota bacterium]
MDITQEIKVIQINVEKELGFPLVPKFWGLVEDTVGNVATDYDGDPEGQKDYVDSYRNVTKRHVEVIKTVPYIKAKPSTNRSEEQPKTKKTYHNPLQRRLHLIDFVWKAKGRIRARANWKRITIQWNKEHPYDQKTQAVLKVEYYRARNDSDVMKNYIALKIALDLQGAMGKVIDFWQQHPEAKNLNELIEIEEVQDER